MFQMGQRFTEYIACTIFIACYGGVTISRYSLAAFEGQKLEYSLLNSYPALIPECHSLLYTYSEFRSYRRTYLQI
jgi:hypothetical protein